MKRVIKNLYSLKGAKSGTRVDELKLQLGIGTDTPTTDYVKHSLAVAANDFLVASGAGVWVKKTLAQVKAILGLGSGAYIEATAEDDFIVATAASTFAKKTVEETRAVLNKLYSEQEDISAGESETTLDPDAFLSFISTDSAGDTFILPDGDVTGQLKKIVMKADGGDSVLSGEGLVTGTFGSDQGTLTFNNAGEYALLQWNGSLWICLELASMLDTTNAPALSS